MPSAQEKRQSKKSGEDAVTVDWIILTAALIGLTVVSVASVQAGSDGLAANLGSYLSY